VAYLVKAKQDAMPLPTAEPQRFSCGLRPAHESPVPVGWSTPAST